jgi:hypothetical protein
MSSKKAIDAALKVLKEKHRKKYNAPLGKRRCAKNVSDDCLGLASEDLFRGSICAGCRRSQLQAWYGERIEKRGGPLKRGRKKKQDSDEETSESEEEQVPEKNVRKSGRSEAKREK